MARRDNDIQEESYTVTIFRDKATGISLSELWKAEVAYGNQRSMNYHRVDGPADTRRDPQTGVTTDEAWYRYGQQHREDGPARIGRDPQTGVVFKELWYQNDNLHRTDGPAAIHRNRVTGEITSRSWFRDGERLPPVRQRRSASKVTSTANPPEPDAL